MDGAWWIEIPNATLEVALAIGKNLGGRGGYWANVTVKFRHEKAYLSGNNPQQKHPHCKNRYDEEHLRCARMCVVWALRDFRGLEVADPPAQEPS